MKHKQKSIDIYSLAYYTIINLLYRLVYRDTQAIRGLLHTRLRLYSKQLGPNAGFCM
jgi:hypothetical protein